MHRLIAATLSIGAQIYARRRRRYRQSPIPDPEDETEQHTEQRYGLPVLRLNTV
ncbi:hypothetical protein [Serratia odorifera]|uniref:hypothetical protein n=1 Tax=Serratia odorifera TaxID=618 RepID=UPI0018E72B26|nr:hypothetical protein [Serratia odorifera]MBJ2064953.1 hypothetical protein [Serratia odorifera]